MNHSKQITRLERQKYDLAVLCFLAFFITFFPYKVRLVLHLIVYYIIWKRITSKNY